MNTKYFFSALLIAILFSVSSCNNDDESLDLNDTQTLSLEFSNLPDLGDDFSYEGWIIVDGVPLTAGVFNVDANGNIDNQSIELDADALTKATSYVLTIEPSPDNDPLPSKVHILGGDFNGNSTDLNPQHQMAMGTDFSDASGGYLLGTPTDGALDTDETSGIWWEDMSSGTAQVSLDLPTLPDGWEYEGWVVVDGQPLTTGKFIEVDKPDFAAPFSGNSPGPPFPGEDFIVNAPNGLSFPLDLSGQITAITVEPSPDNSPLPFSMKTLIHTIPADAEIHTSYQMINDALNTNPRGRVFR